jgi:hypothetical protein
LPAQPDMSPPGRPTRRPPGPAAGTAGRRWGSLQGGLGVCVVVASTAVGAILTMVAGDVPGDLLGAFVVIGAVAAALAVRPAAGRMILPVPVLSYLVAALISGVIYNRTGSSTTALAIGAAQWIANGFFAMVLATVLAIVIIAIRWYLARRRRPAASDPAWSVPTAGPVQRLPRPPGRRDARTDPGYPAGSRDSGSIRDGGGLRGPGTTRDAGGRRGAGGNPGWNDPASPGPTGPNSRRLLATGPWPYNFSSGA